MGPENRSYWKPVFVARIGGAGELQVKSPSNNMLVLYLAPVWLNKKFDRSKLKFSGLYPSSEKFELGLKLFEVSMYDLNDTHQLSTPLSTRSSPFVKSVISLIKESRYGRSISGSIGPV